MSLVQRLREGLNLVQRLREGLSLLLLLNLIGLHRSRERRGAVGGLRLSGELANLLVVRLVVGLSLARLLVGGLIVRLLSSVSRGSVRRVLRSRVDGNGLK